MTPDEAQAVKARIEAAPDLFSARYMKHYETMAAWLASNGGPKLSELEVHQLMVG